MNGFVCVPLNSVIDQKGRTAVTLWLNSALTAVRSDRFLFAYASSPLRHSSPASVTIRSQPFALNIPFWLGGAS